MADRIAKIKPHLTISICLILPVPNTMAFGGVATGITNAQEAPIPMMIIRVSLGKPICAAIAPNTGTNKAADAVFYVNSVIAITNTDTKTINNQVGMPANIPAKVLPNT